MNPHQGVLVPLADRIRWTTAARIGVLALPVALWFARPDLRSAGLTPILVGAALVMVASVVLLPVQKLGRRAALTAVGVTLLLDGAYLAGCFLVLGEFDGPIGYVLMLHAIAVTLLTSFRTGLKVVLWHSIALLVALQAQLTGLVDGPLTGADFPTGDFALFLGLLWTATLGTATFAAANERELRRRRYDAEVLRRLALDLEQADDVAEIAQTLARVAHTELDARRAAVVVCTASVRTDQTVICGPGASPVVRLAPDSVPTDWHAPLESGIGSTLVTACERHTTLLVPALDPVAEGWLTELLPGARNLVVVPFVLDQAVMGALVLEHGAVSRRERLLRREARIERRRVATAEQATAHAAQAFGRAALVARLRSSADTDGLTGVANRRAFDRALAAELARTARTGASTAVLLIDVDHFKAVNDTFGHQAGDDVLRTLASVLDDSCRTGDLPARYGGEEFAVVASGTGVEGGRVLAERIRAAIAGASAPRVTVSIGVAAAEGLDSPDELLRAADRALYAAKQSGRDRVVTAEQVAVGFGGGHR